MFVREDNELQNHPLISVIIPVYNAETYLVQCIKSVINQTYRNLEIICIDDGSSDKSGEILDSYAQIDERIQVIHKENQGVSSARNDALQLSHGSYVMFVDADDWIDIDTCKQAISVMINHDADVVMWSYISEHLTSKSRKEIFATDIIFDREEVLCKLHRRYIGILNEELAYPEQADSLCTVWGKLYRRNIIKEKGIVFTDLDTIGTYEDGLFNMEFFFYVNRVVYLNQCLYHYRRQNQTSITSDYREKLFNQWKNLFHIMKDYIRRYNLPRQYEEALNNRIALSTLGLGLNIVNSGLGCRKKIRLLKEILFDVEYREAYRKLDFQYLPLHWKLFYGSAAHRFTLGVYILLVIIRKIING